MDLLCMTTSYLRKKRDGRVAEGYEEVGKDPDYRKGRMEMCVCVCVGTGYCVQEVVPRLVSADSGLSTMVTHPFLPSYNAHTHSGL